MAGRRGGNRKSGASGALYTHTPHLSSVIGTSRDGRRAVQHTSFIDARLPIPDYHQDDPKTNAAVEAVDFSYDLGDNSLPPDMEPPDTAGIDLQKNKKKKRNENSVILTSSQQLLVLTMG